MKKQTFTIQVTRAEFLKLPMPMRRRALARHADVLVLNRAIDVLAVALAGHKHKWTARERDLYEEAAG